MSLRSVLGTVYDHLPLKAPVLRILRPLRLPPSVYQHLHFHGIVEVPVPAGSFKMVHCAEEIENELFWEGLPGHRERVSMSLWMRLCPGARVIVDVGANSGVYALVARAYNRSAHVLAFEPLPDLHARLVRNAELNGYTIDAPRAALSDRSGVVHMTGWFIDHDSDAGLAVPTVRLDAVLAERGIAEVDLMKIDVEGHEPAVLRGMGELLERCRPTMLLEVLSQKAAVELDGLIGHLGYVYYDLDEVHPPRRMPKLAKSSHWNVLACSPVVAKTLDLPLA